nr:unnamed protein product [Callosobruchus analis]
MKVPKTATEWLNISKEFEIFWNIPNTIGAMDGKHIAFQGAKSAGSTYYYYKGEHSMVLLAMVDATYKLIYIDIGVNGRVSDGGVYARSSLAIHLTSQRTDLYLDAADQSLTLF